MGDFFPSEAILATRAANEVPIGIELASDRSDSKMKLPMPLSDKQVALAHHWVMSYRGGERVLEQIAALFPGAAIHTLVRDPNVRVPGIEGRDVLVVEDIVDTGHTLAHVLHLLESRHPRKLRTIALLDKPSRRETDITADWTGFIIPDEFVVGYGIDYAQRNRNLPCIGKVRFTDG